MTNPKAGHTSASGMTVDSQGLRDGDGLTSPSLTNLYEAIHGNGILRLGDGAKGDGNRNMTRAEPWDLLLICVLVVILKFDRCAK